VYTKLVTNLNYYRFKFSVLTYHGRQ